MTRLRARVDDAARGSDVPAGLERGAAAAPRGFRARTAMRRRLRELGQLREAQLVELGALVLEAQRHGRDSSALIEQKAGAAAASDDEARALADALDSDAGLDGLVADGITGPCPTCGTLASTSARFCSTCGTPLDDRPDAAPRVEAEASGGAAEGPETIAETRESESPLTHVPDADAPVADRPTTELRTTNGHNGDPDRTEEPTRSDV